MQLDPEIKNIVVLRIYFSVKINVVIVMRALFLYQKITVNADNVVVLIIEDSLVQQRYLAALNLKLFLTLE